MTLNLESLLFQSAIDYLFTFWTRVILIVSILAGLGWLLERYWRRYLASDFLHQRGEIFPPPSREYNPLKAEVEQRNFTYLPQNIHKFVGGERRWEPLPEPFRQLESLLKNPDSERYIFLMAQPGMGKTAFVEGCRQWLRYHPGLRYRIACIPFTRPDARLLLLKIPRPRNTILILDGVESELATARFPVKRLCRWIDKTRKFPLVIILGRPESLPEMSKISGESGLCKFTEMTGDGYAFYLYWLAPPDREVQERWVKSTVPFYQPQRRQSIAEEMQKRRNGISNPLFFRYLPLLNERRPASRAEAYELIFRDMLEAERGKCNPPPEIGTFRDFWESFAAASYRQRVSGSGVSLTDEALEALLASAGINAGKWKPERSALAAKNQLGNWQFREKTIEEYLVFRRFLQQPEAFSGVRFTKFIQELLWGWFEAHLAGGQSLPEAWLQHADLSHFVTRLPAPAEPLGTLGEITNVQLTEILRKYRFFDRVNRPRGPGLHHLFEKRIFNGEAVIIDHATGLMWEQGDRFQHPLTYEIISQGPLKVACAGHNDWRLPSLEEGLSLLHPQVSNGLYLPPILHDNRSSIWVAEKAAPGEQFVVHFAAGTCRAENVASLHYLRLVRKIQPE